MNSIFFKTLYSIFIVPSYRRSKRSITTLAANMNVFTQKRNPITGNTEWDIQRDDYDYHQEIARSSFADMLHDTERNKKYHRALQLAIEKMHSAGKMANVLDIGTGTGLLSIMAARCGADSIIACEAFKPMAECCLKVLEQNGVADKITVIPKRSTELTVGEDGDMKQKANILVTEVFDTELIGEGALSTFSHAHKYLLEEDCIVVPDSAVIYAQVVECYTLQNWNKLNDLADEEMEIILKTPQKIKDCPGAAAVHDIQLSHLQRHQFIELSEPIPVLYYDWSGRTPIDMNRTVKQTFTTLGSGKAHIVFTWWELNMDTEGKIVLSCAPWWSHPAAQTSVLYPQDTIPWRDHWMQGVYYLPQSLELRQFSEVTLVTCQDEYSLWFYLEDENNKHSHYKRPACECGVHMAFSRTHVAYLNNRIRSNNFIKTLKEELKEKKEAIVLDLNGSSLMGLAAAKLGAKRVYILENTNFNIAILNDYIAENKIENVSVISEIAEDLFLEITTVTCDPNFASAILPWENLKMAHILFQYRNKLREDVTVIPEMCMIMAVPVEFHHLHKIRIPLGTCEGINMAAFDELIENSREISDAEVEPQPLWEYSSVCRGIPQKVLEIDLRRVKLTYANDATHQIGEEGDGPQPINGFALWALWKVGNKCLGGGTTEWPHPGNRLFWDPCTRQAVHILKQTHLMQSTDRWSFRVACDIEKGQFDVRISLEPQIKPQEVEAN